MGGMNWDFDESVLGPREHLQSYVALPERKPRHKHCKGVLVEGCDGCVGWHRGEGVAHNHCDIFFDTDYEHYKLANGHRVGMSFEINPATGKHWCFKRQLEDTQRQAAGGEG